MNIRFQQPTLPSLNAVAKYFSAAEAAGQFSNFGPCHERFLRELSIRLGHDSLVLTANATAALQICVTFASTSRPGRTLVAMPSFTFAAAAAATTMSGLTPVFVDIDSEGWFMDPDRLKVELARYPGKFAAVIACSPFGTPAPTAVQESWSHAAKQAGAQLIIDSAAGFGASNADAQAAGSGMYLEVFSLHATKPLAIGEGGLIVAPSQRMADELQSMTNFGFHSGGRVSNSLGTNAKLAEIACATGLAALETFDEDIRIRRKRAEMYLDLLRETPYTFQKGCDFSVWQFVPLLAASSTHREGALRALSASSIEARTYYEPIHRFPAFRRAGPVADYCLPITSDVATRILSLPMSTVITEAQVRNICDTVASVKR
jgi:dTDP-4-amino-4,6-dideoxygalactose transaminase